MIELVRVSIHALLAECDLRSKEARVAGKSFNPRTPCGVRPKTFSSPPAAKSFQSTHSLRSATAGNLRRDVAVRVSIHALLAECDQWIDQSNLSRIGFNPRTPCGVRLTDYQDMASWQEFQSTHSLRSATGESPGSINYRKSFNPRTPCGVRPARPDNPACRSSVSIHALLAECDFPSREANTPLMWFQSTHSLRSATSAAMPGTACFAVSIHALLAECDCAQPYTLLLNKANHTLRQPP